ncbi:hypothetical protein ACFV4P_25455 [Kitasatospora sp. NPDC059795]|uniref:hypothetical protein n=1 Tax=Kitasatospora sp. NPDC059795 TaxID=3346949 RepID=UPI00366240A4
MNRTDHLTEEQFVRLSGAGTGPTAGLHLAGCEPCQEQAASWTRLAEAAADADLLLTREATAPPSFDALLGGRLPARAAAAEPVRRPAAEPVRAPVAAAAPRPVAGTVWSRSRAWRIARQLTVRQVGMLPRSLGPITFAGLLLAGAVALLSPPGYADRLGAAAISLVVLLGSLGVVSSRRDPRKELLQALPVPPVTVFLARVTLVLAADLVGGLLVSVASGLLGGPAVGEVIAGWLGPALLSAGLAMVVAVWKAPWLGLAAGGGLWLTGTFVTLPHTGRRPVGLGALLIDLWTTGPLTVAAGLLLVGCAVRLVALPGRSVREG